VKYLGGELSLDIVQDGIAMLVTLQEDNRLRICLADPAHKDAIKAALVTWYRRHALSNFSSRIGELAPRLNVPVPRLFLSNAQTRWGSCNAKHEVRLNWRLIQAAQPTIDYVVVHELAHLREMNHSRRFWTLVASVCPHYRDACDELNRMGLYYMDI
jgi:predicted metal-dependent hydrolase